MCWTFLNKGVRVVELKERVRQLISDELTYSNKQINAVLNLLEEGNTVPFIARYRKEQTGALDEVQIREIGENYQRRLNLEEQKEQILAKIENQGKLTPELTIEIKNAQNLTRLEDLYRPYKQKRRTKATIAKEQGLEPLALKVLQDKNCKFEEEIKNYLIDEISTGEEVRQGVIEIIAESISENASYRKWIRNYLWKNANLVTKLKKDANDEKEIYAMYYDFYDTVLKIPNYRILAINRGEKEKVLKVSFECDLNPVMNYLEQKLKIETKEDEQQKEIILNSIKESLKRFIIPAIEREIRAELTERAEEQAIKVFGQNLEQLLMQAPLKNKVVMGYDPAYRTGCKLAVVDETGKLLTVDVIYPTPSPKQDIEDASKRFKQLVDEYNVEMVAIGNGTASRESEQFVSEQLQEMKKENLYYTIVNEAGASVYSASDLARAEFPDLQVEERSAVSIARRLQDPLAELVKIDPKSVGVGQYQHDVSQKQLNLQLDFVVETAVNKVGVDLNTASPALLMHISGLNKTTANNIVKYRNEVGAFKTRKEVKNVSRLGPKAYEQAIGFLRIPKGENILDNTDIHPEVYDKVEQILNDLGLANEEIGTTASLQKLAQVSVDELSQKYDLGLETIKDIIASLQKPGRDLREDMPKPILRKDVLTMEDLKSGMELKGTVRNIVDFGAFVDIGVKQDGLVHISKISHQFLKHPSQVLSVGDIVTVYIEEVDLKKQRIALTMLKTKED